MYFLKMVECNLKPRAGKSEDHLSDRANKIFSKWYLKTEQNIWHSALSSGEEYSPKGKLQIERKKGNQPACPPF